MVRRFKILNIEFIKLYYDKSILIRLFWISYACDILSASTHARVYYNMNDVFIDDVPKIP